MVDNLIGFLYTDSRVTLTKVEPPATYIETEKQLNQLYTLHVSDSFAERLY